MNFELFYFIVDNSIELEYFSSQFSDSSIKLRLSLLPFLLSIESILTDDMNKEHKDPKSMMMLFEYNNKVIFDSKLPFAN